MTVDYSKSIRIIRAATGLSQAEFASSLDKDSSLISRIESGNRKPSHNLVEKIGEVYGVPPHLVTLLGSDTSDTYGEHMPDIGSSLLKVLINLDKKAD